MNPVLVIGPRERKPEGDCVVVNTTSRSEGLGREFSPFFLGPVPLYAGMQAQRMENAWQYAKVYPGFTDADGYPAHKYFAWAKEGWRSEQAHRYPMGKGAKPLYAYWEGERLDYIEARKRIYVPLYRDAVVKTRAYQKLKALHTQGRRIVLWDYDGYDHRALGMNHWDVLNTPARSLGHAFVIAMLLEHGEGFTFEHLQQAAEKTAPAASQGPQMGLL